MKVLIGYPNLPMMFTPALAVGLFTAICKKQNVEVKLFETTNYTDDEMSGMLFKSKLGGGRLYNASDIKLELKPRDQVIPDWVEMVTEYQPDLILISTVEDTYDETIGMLQSIHHMNIPHIVGGVFPINAPELTLESEYINTICRYEGELVVEQVLQKMKANEDWQTIDGLWYKRNGKIVKNPLQPLCDINAITPDYELYDDYRFLRPIGGRIVKALQIETYRGCPYSCTFCNSPMTRSMDKNFLRRKTMDHMRKELQYYVDTINPDYWFIGDDSFIARPRQEIFDICEVLEEFNIPWWCNTRLENVDEEILAAMKRGHCDRIQFGIESGNEEYRKNVLKRNVSNDLYYEKAKILNESDIPYGLNVIIGMPGETKSMVTDTVEMIKKMRGYDGIGISRFIPYHGTQLRQYAIDHGWLNSEWRSRDGYLPQENLLTMPLPFIQPSEIEEVLTTFKFYCFFDHAYWESIQYAYQTSQLDKLEDIYNDEFYTLLASGGATHCSSRYNNKYACASAEYVDFRQILS